MSTQMVPIPLGRLLCPELTPAVKLVWIGLQLDRHLPRKQLRSPTRIQRRIGVSRPTIRKAFACLARPSDVRLPNDLVGLGRLRVRVHADLITDKTVPALARVLYCILLGLRRLKRHDILSSYAAIAKVVHLQPRTVRRAVRALVAAGWLAISQPHKRAPVHFSFPDRKLSRQRADVLRAKQRLKKSGNRGETLALLWCDTLVDSNHHMDDCFPDFLTNPRTNELLQADRYYLDHKVIIEFQGPQHDGPTQQYSATEVAKQMARDRIKREICARQGVPLIELRPEDLTFRRLRTLLSKVLPLRDVTPDEPIVCYLEMESRQYMKAIARIRQPVLRPCRHKNDRPSVASRQMTDRPPELARV